LVASFAASCLAKVDTSRPSNPSVAHKRGEVVPLFEATVLLKHHLLEHNLLKLVLLKHHLLLKTVLLFKHNLPKLVLLKLILLKHDLLKLTMLLKHVLHNLRKLVLLKHGLL
jgi:hypothetical protein